MLPGRVRPSAVWAEAEVGLTFVSQVRFSTAETAEVVGGASSDGVAELGTSAAHCRRPDPQAQLDYLKADLYGLRIGEPPEPESDQVISPSVRTCPWLLYSDYSLVSKLGNELFLGDMEQGGHIGHCLDLV